MSTITTEKINVEPLRGEIREAARGFSTRLVEALGENLQSISVVGSALTTDFHPKHSDINTVLRVEKVGVGMLQTLAGFGAEMGRQRFRAPLVMTDDFIRRSMDVFGVEYLDFQLNHMTVYGPDPFMELAFNKECVRLQCERELRTAQFQLWGGYIRGLGHHKSVGPLLAEGVGKLLPLLRGLLWLMEVDRPKEAKTTVEMAGLAFNFDGRWVATLLNLRQRDKKFNRDEIDGMFQDVCEVVELLCRKVDELPTK
jgi:hypothetical protein